jgi:hypothetical protein
LVANSSRSETTSLIQTGGRYFLFLQPRRFGKSLKKKYNFWWTNESMNWKIEELIDWLIDRSTNWWIKKFTNSKIICNRKNDWTDELRSKYNKHLTDWRTGVSLPGLFVNVCLDLSIHWSISLMIVVRWFIYFVNLVICCLINSLICPSIYLSICWFVDCSISLFLTR